MLLALEALKLKHNKMIRKTSSILKWVSQTDNQRTKLPLNSLSNIVNPYPERFNCETPFAHKIQHITKCVCTKNAHSCNKCTKVLYLLYFLFDNFVAKTILQMHKQAQQWSLCMMIIFFIFIFNVSLSSRDCNFLITRRSILGSDGMTKSDCSLALWVHSECPLSAVWVLYISALWIHPEVILKSSWSHH